MQMSMMNESNVLLSFSESAGSNVQVERIFINPGEMLPLKGYPEERLYYVQSGYGVLSVYDRLGEGDTYILRANVAAYFTPGLMHEVHNLGDLPMLLVLFRIQGGLMPDGVEEGVEKWTSIGRSKEIGTGFWYTDVFDLSTNETAREGQHLQVWGINLRRPQKLVGGEVLSLAEKRATRCHAHSETNETFYILMGTGHFVVEKERIPFDAGAVCSVPAGVVHSVDNTGDSLLLYMCITTEGCENGGCYV